MRTLTNRLGLPRIVLDALRNEKYDRGDAEYSVTQLIAPAWQAKLKREHDYEEDASGLIYSLLGRSVHAVIESATDGAVDVMVERRFYTELDGVRISGQVDLIEGDTLTDFKVTSTHKRDVGPEWEAQVNIYRYLAFRNCVTVNGMQILAIYRDWSGTQAKRDAHGYPRSPVAVFPVRGWDFGRVEEYLRSRLAQHRSSNPELCTDEERWARPGVFAVMRDGRKSAIKLHESAAAAEMQAKLLGKGHFVVERPKTYPRCESFCPVSKFCKPWQDFKSQQREEEA